MLVAASSGYVGHHECGYTAAGRQTSLLPAEDSASAGGPPHAGPFGPDLLRLTYSNQPPASAGASREGTPDTAQLASRSGLLQGGAQHATSRASNGGGCAVERVLNPPVVACPAPCPVSHIDRVGSCSRGVQAGTGHQSRPVLVPLCMAQRCAQHVSMTLSCNTVPDAAGLVGPAELSALSRADMPSIEITAWACI